MAHLSAKPQHGMNKANNGNDVPQPNDQGHAHGEPSPLAEATVVIDPHIWKKSGLARSEFLKRIRSFKKLRLRPVMTPQEATTLPVFSYLPRTLESWGLLERFHNLVNKGDFSVFDGRTSDFIAALIIAPRLATWLLNTKLATLQNQVLNWLAAYLTWHSDLPDKRTTRLPTGLHEKVEAIIRKHYSGRFSHKEVWKMSNSAGPQDLADHYEDVSRELTGAAPPEILKLRNWEVRDVRTQEWGLSDHNPSDWIGFDFHYDYGYIPDNDWKAFIVEGQECELDAAESSEDLRQKWLHTLDLYPQRKGHLFSITGGEAQLGYVYILRNEATGHYKIGFTACADPYGRLASLQTGSPERLIRVGHFRAASLKTEAVVQRHWAAKRLRPDGEWFALSAEDLANLLDEDWRITNNIF
jgi:hypothetical protein